MPFTDRKLRVFLCHASQDKPIVRELYQRLNAEGWIDPWLDEEKLLPGQGWDIEIEKAVDNTDVVIVCLSNNSVTKEGYVQRELKFASDIALEKPEGTIFIIPLRLDDCQVPRRLRVWQYVDYFSGQQEKNYFRLINALNLRFHGLIGETPLQTVHESPGSPSLAKLAGNTTGSQGVEKDNLSGIKEQKIWIYFEWYMGLVIGVLPYIIFVSYLVSLNLNLIWLTLLNYLSLAICFTFIGLWQRKILLRYKGLGNFWASIIVLYVFVLFLTDVMTGGDAHYYLWVITNGFWYLLEIVLGPFFLLRRAVSQSRRNKVK